MNKKEIARRINLCEKYEEDYKKLKSCIVSLKKDLNADIYKTNIPHNQLTTEGISKGFF